MKWLSCDRMRLLVVFVAAVVLCGRCVKAESFRIGPAADVMLGNDAQLGPDRCDDTGGLHVRDISVRRRVALISYDISELKGKGPVSNVSFNHVSWDQGDETHVYGIIEDLDLLQVELLTWNTAPGVQNDPTPALGSPVALDMNDLTDVLVTFTGPGPGPAPIRFSTDSSQTLDDFINSDTDGILTFLLAASKEGNSLIILSSEELNGGSLLEGIVAPSDAAAYYAMENDAADSSDNGYDGVLFGDPALVKGVDGLAVELDYSDDYVELPIGSLIGSLTDCTIATWVNWPGLGGAWQRIFDFGSGEEINMFLTPNIAGARTPRFCMTLNGIADNTTSSDVLPTGWHHMAVTIDPANTTHTLLIDGEVVAQNTKATLKPSDLGETTQNYLGKSQYNDPLFYGSLDEFAIYTRTLSETEIAEMVAQQLPDPGPIAHWKLDEHNGSIAHDSAGKYDGVVLGVGGSATWQPEGGMVDGALEFDGVDDCVWTPCFVLNTAYSEFSVFAWVKGGAPGQVIISQYGHSRDWLYADPSDGCLMTELRNDANNDPLLLSEVVITDGQWHNVGFVWDLSRRTLYVDEVEVASDEQESVGTLNGLLSIGVGYSEVHGSFWSGLIDDVRIYNRAVMP